MSFRQALRVLWQRRWIIIALVLLAVLAAGYFASRQTPVFASSATLRVSAAAVSGQLQANLGSIEIDLEPDSLASPVVLRAAAAELREPPTALYGTVSYALTEGARTDRLTITALGPTSESARQRADAVAEAYIAYIQGQIDAGLTVLESRLADVTEQATVYNGQVRVDPTDSIAQSNLAQALSTMGTLRAQIDTIKNSDAALTLLSPAGGGTQQGTSMTLIVALAGLCALLSGMGVALLMDQFDTRLREPRELETLDGLPVIAEIPFDRHLRRHPTPLSEAARRRNPLNEAFRALRTGLQVLQRTTRPSVVVTSVSPGDGKTFVAAHLAVAWARAGKRVILVAGDMRRPALPRHFGDAAEGPGLADLLRSEPGDDDLTRRITDLLNETDVRGLRILASGTDDADTSDLLATQVWSIVLGRLETIADVIVIDSPPSLSLSDAALLSAPSGGTIVVAALGSTRRDQYEATLQQLRQADVAILGVAANRSRRRIPANHAAYYRTTEPPVTKPTQAPTAAPSERPGIDDSPPPDMRDPMARQADSPVRSRRFPVTPGGRDNATTVVSTDEGTSAAADA